MVWPGMQAAWAQEASVSLRAQLVASRFTTLSAGLSAQVRTLKAQEGQLVQQGDTLVTLDCEVLQASKTVAKARLRATEAKHKSAQALLKLNSASPLEVALAGAEKEMAQGELQSITAQLKPCVVKAPFDARIVASKVQPHQYVELGAPMLEIYDPGSLEVQFVAPSTLLHQLKTGTPFRLMLDEIGLEVSGQLSRLGGKIDPVSQTIQVYGELKQPSELLLEGMSGSVTLLFESEPQP